MQMDDQMNGTSGRRSTNSRRTVLKLGGLSLASAVGAATVGTVTAQSDEKPDVDFDPDRREEVAEFILALGELESENQQRRYTAQLTDEQMQAMEDLYGEVDWEIRSYRQNATQPSDNWVTTTEVTEAKGSVPIIGTVYVHKQILTWDYNGSDYRNVSQELDYELPGPAAAYKGTTTDDIDRNATSFTAELSAEYAFDPPGGERRKEATIITKGDNNGNHEVLSKSAPASTE